MRKVFVRILSIALVSLGLMAVSCKEQDPNQGAKQLKIEPREVGFAKGASSQTITVTTNAGSWKAVIKEGDWFTISPDSGTAPGGEVTISATECGANARSGKLEFSAPGCLKVTVNVSQEPVSEVIGPGKTGLFTLEDTPDVD